MKENFNSFWWIRFEYFEREKIEIQENCVEYKKKGKQNVMYKFVVVVV